MSIYDTSLLQLNPKADERFVVSGEKYRITILTEQLLRLEYSENGEFEDRATRFAVNRAFAEPKFEKYYEDGLLHIKTDYLHLKYDEKPFSASGLHIIVNGTEDWSYGTKMDNLGGTTRTIDGSTGPVELSDGLLSARGGSAVVDDSKTIVLGEDGWPVPLLADRTDIYFFGYRKDFEKCIRDFYLLSGRSPILPRFALGNWWSRFYRYTDKQFRELMENFKEHNVPLSVAVIDMDWHIIRTPDPKKYGSGWTGYTWNKELFPDYKDFLKYLHDNNLKTALNLHPKDGIRAFEEQYPALCKRLGRDPKEEKQIEFDVSNREFMEAYFDTVLNPYEDDGVDFWWLDWQQRDHTKIPGYDVLWMINHCHYLDSARNGNVPLTFSRYAEIGSHRYPIGFSGDSVINWDVLNFQPYFTATAANVGFSWWSHDIGGHCMGTNDDELYTRWIQFGVFSPIMRLHSTSGPFFLKEPWKKSKETERIAEDFLRLRHKLVPYIFTKMYKNHEDGIPMVRPLYHAYPTINEIFAHKNEYLFGDFIVCPITSKLDPESRLGSVKGYLPRGKYIDIFTSHIYSGNRTVNLHRPIDKMPVFAKLGTILPLAENVNHNGVDNPESLELRVYGGDNGTFTLVEDNGKIGNETKVLRTTYDFTYGEESKLTFTSPKSIETVPQKRGYKVVFCAFEKPERVTLSINGIETVVETSYDEARHEINIPEFAVNECDEVCITVLGSGALPANNIYDAAYDAILNAQISYDLKTNIWNAFNKVDWSDSQKIDYLLNNCTNKNIMGYLVELLSAN